MGEEGGVVCGDGTYRYFWCGQHVDIVAEGDEFHVFLRVGSRDLGRHLEEGVLEAGVVDAFFLK